MGIVETNFDGVYSGDVRTSIPASSKYLHVTQSLPLLGTASNIHRQLK